MIEPPSPTASHDDKNLDNLKEGKPSQIGRIVWRKLDIWILPLCTSLFLLSSVDKNNFANARLAGMETTLAMSDYQYTLALTVTYVSYTAIEFPSNLLLKYVGPDRMLPAMAILWGAVCALQGVVDNYSGLLVCRFILGLFEGGVFPGIIIYLSFFYPRERLQMRVTVFYALTALAGCFSGLLAAAIDGLNGKGGKPGWAWIFILEGAFSCVFGAISFFLLPRAPETARFLTLEERVYVISALKGAGSVSEDGTQDRFSWTEVARSAKSPHLWLITVVFFFAGASVNGLFFEPVVIASLGYSGNQAQLMSAPPFAVASVVAFISAIISDRYQCRGYVTIFFSLVQLIGFVMFYASTSTYVRFGALFLSVTGSFCVVPAVITWLANNSAPHIRRATSVAIAYLVGQLGGLLAIWLLGWVSPAPNYTAAMLTFIVMSAGMVLFSAANLLYLWRENGKKAERRQRMRKEDEPEGLGDRSAWFIYSL